MKKHIKILKQQNNYVETTHSKDSQLAEHFSSLLDSNNKSNHSIVEEMKRTLQNFK